MARRTLVVEVMLAALMLVGVVPTESRAMTGSVQYLTVAPAMTWQQSVKLADRVNCLLTGPAPEARRLRVFVRGMSALTGWVREGCSCPSGKKDGVCRQMGELLLRQQALEREGRKPQVAAFLQKVREARVSGMTEAQVRAMVRDGMARGDLSLSADAERRAVRQRVDELNRQLVGGSPELAQISAR
jgi:hypothetical protein